MTQNTIQSTNSTLVSMTANISLAQEKRVVAVQETISIVIQAGKDNTIFSTKKTAMAMYIKEQFADKAVDKYTKRALVIAKKILLDGYKAKKELLTIAQLEQLLSFPSSKVNEIMSISNDDLYVVAVKDLIKTAKVSKSTKVFSKANARLK